MYQLKSRNPSLRSLIKIHKDGRSIRPVVNYKNGPSYKLVKLFTGILKLYIPLPNICNVQNSVQLMKDLSEIPFVPELKLTSLDISNMYTNIPTDDLINVIDTSCKNTI
jgi:hypothetical protein